MLASQEALRLCQILASLNYEGQRIHITPTLFAKPNINLVYDLLCWSLRIVHQQSFKDEQDKYKMSDLDESSRVRRLIDVCKSLNKQLGIKLNLVTLYTADTTCCPELLKVVEPIYDAAKVVVDRKKTTGLPLHVEGSKKLAVDNLTNARSMALQVLELLNQKGGIKELLDGISNLGGELDLLLGEDEKFNEKRMLVIDHKLELAEIEQALLKARDKITTKTSDLCKTNEGLAIDLTRLDERLQMKETEVKEAKDRLNELLFQAPNYLERYEKLHAAYEVAYANYISKYRNLMYLKSCVYCEDEDLTNIQPDDDGLIALDATGDTTGPPKLLESLLEGNSKPMSASLAAVTGIGAGVEKAAELVTRDESEFTPGMRERKVGARGENEARSGFAVGDTEETGLGLELEGLLNEFMVDAEDGREKVDLSGKDDEDEDEELDGSEEDDIDEDEDEDEDENGLERSAKYGK